MVSCQLELVDPVYTGGICTQRLHAVKHNIDTSTSTEVGT
jgi:hypothetical protein